MNNKTWHENFIEYMDFIVDHNNYKNLPIEKTSAPNKYKWVTSAKTPTGIKRIQWAEDKAKSLKIPLEPGVYSKVMFNVHPTKEKTCQICGKKMSLLYIYPNSAFIIFLKKKYNIDVDRYDDVHKVNQKLKTLAKLGDEEIKNIYIDKLNLKKTLINSSLKAVVDEAEYFCRVKSKKLLGPGAMSNFPDRYDGFHTYNRCCRTLQDTGRHPENMKTYSKDRRAYEYWSDGNFQAANKFMSSSHFKNTSADHIGPISLGFIHDPKFLQKMDSKDNSAKRDKLLKKDYFKLLEIEKEINICPVSWFAKVIWEDMKFNLDQSSTSTKELNIYQKILKINMVNFMNYLWLVKHCDTSKNSGIIFLEHFYLDPKIEYFRFKYSFNSNGSGDYTKKIKKESKTTTIELNRYKRISLDAIDEFKSKKNRNLKPTDLFLFKDELDVLFKKISENPTEIDTKVLFESIFIKIESHLLDSFKLKSQL